MLWVLIYLAIGLTTLVVLGFLLLGLWRKVKALSGEVSRASARIGPATDELARLSDENARRLGTTDTGGRHA